MLLRPHPGPVGLHTGGHFDLTATGELTAEDIHTLICSSSGPFRALNLIVESSNQGGFSGHAQPKDTFYKAFLCVPTSTGQTSTALS